MWHKVMMLLIWPFLASALLVVAPPVRENLPASPTPVIDLVQDRCEPNDTEPQACELALDQVNGPFTFLPAGDQDYYSVNLGEQVTGQELQVSVRATSELDLLTTLKSAGSLSPAAIMSSPVISTTLPVTLTGWLLLRVENRAAAIPIGQSYTIELRRVLPPPTQVLDPGGTPVVPVPDALENNWSPETAAPVAIGVVYDLTFACPESWPGACPGGDHDYLQVPVKAGSRYQLAAFDPGPGVDPVVDLFWQDLQQPVASNDDAFSGGFASLVQWAAPANGELIIRIGPRNGSFIPAVPDQHQQNGSRPTTSGNTPGAGEYRFAIALLNSQLANQILQRIAMAANVTLPTAHAGSGNGSVATTATPGVASSPATDGPTGQAYVSNPAGTSLHDAPDPQATRIQTLAVEALVTLTGQSSGAWVRATPQDGVVPGWVYGPDLRLTHAPEPTPGVETDLSGMQPTTQPTSTVAPAQPVQPTVTPAEVRIERLPPRLLLPAPTSMPRTSFTIQVTIGAAMPISNLRTPTTGGPTPTPIPIRPLEGVRVQLTTVFGDLLIEAVTSVDGTVALTRDLAPQQGLRLRVPAAGLDLPLDPAQRNLLIALPQGGQ